MSVVSVECIQASRCLRTGQEIFTVQVSIGSLLSDVLVTFTDWSWDINQYPLCDEEHKALDVAVTDAMAQARLLDMELLQDDEWHIPFITREHYETNGAGAFLNYSCMTTSGKKVICLGEALELSELACRKFGGDKKSHQAKPMSVFDAIMWRQGQLESSSKGITHMDRKRNLWSGPLKLWIQNREISND